MEDIKLFTLTGVSKEVHCGKRIYRNVAVDIIRCGDCSDKEQYIDIDGYAKTYASHLFTQEELDILVPWLEDEHRGIKCEATEEPLPIIHGCAAADVLGVGGGRDAYIFDDIDGLPFAVNAYFDIRGLTPVPDYNDSEVYKPILDSIKEKLLVIKPRFENIHVCFDGLCTPCLEEIGDGGYSWESDGEPSGPVRVSRPQEYTISIKMKIDPPDGVYRGKDMDDLIKNTCEAAVKKIEERNTHSSS